MKSFWDISESKPPDVPEIFQLEFTGLPINSYMKIAFHTHDLQHLKRTYFFTDFSKMYHSKGNTSVHNEQWNKMKKSNIILSKRYSM